MENILDTILETKRCILRPVKESDLEDIYDYYKEPIVVKFLPFNHHKNTKDTKRFIKKFFLDKYKKNQMTHLAIVSKEDNIVIGNAGFNEISKDKMVGEIGICINPKYWGKDLSTEISSEIIRYGFKELKLEKIVANIFDKNNYSRKSLEKIGFNYIGIKNIKYKKSTVACHHYEFEKKDYKL